MAQEVTSGVAQRVTGVDASVDAGFHAEVSAAVSGQVAGQQQGQATDSSKTGVPRGSSSSAQWGPGYSPTAPMKDARDASGNRSTQEEPAQPGPVSPMGSVRAPRQGASPLGNKRQKSTLGESTPAPGIGTAVAPPAAPSGQKSDVSSALGGGLRKRSPAIALRAAQLKKRKHKRRSAANSEAALKSSRPELSLRVARSGAGVGSKRP